MAFPTWPASLPQSMLIGNSDMPLSNTVKFQPQVGAPTLYQVGDSRARWIKGSVRINDEQLETFLEFFQITLRNGSRRFNWESPSFDGHTLRLQFEDANPYSLAVAGYGHTLSLNLCAIRTVA